MCIDNDEWEMWWKKNPPKSQNLHAASFIVHVPANQMDINSLLKPIYSGGTEISGFQFVPLAISPGPQPHRVKLDQTFLAVVAFQGCVIAQGPCCRITVFLFSIIDYYIVI